METVTQFVSHYGYLAIFILLMPGIFGIPLPDELLLTFVGYLARRGDLQLLPALAVVVGGAILGITLDYWVGRAAGVRWKGPGAGFRLRPGRLEKLRERLHRYGGWGLCLGYFVPGVRHWAAIAAGMTGFPLAGFSRFAYPGALAWSWCYVGLGYFLGQEAGPWAERIIAPGQIAAASSLALLAGYLLTRGRWLRKKWPKVSGKAVKPLIP